MKKILPAMLLFLFGCASLQPQQTPEAKVYPVEGVKKQQLMTKANQWIAENFGSAKDVIQYKNIPEGKMICKGVGSVRASGDMFDRKYYYTWVLEFKDDKIKMEFKNIIPLNEGKIVGSDYNGFTKKKIDADMDFMMKRMIDYIKKGSKSSNW